MILDTLLRWIGVFIAFVVSASVAVMVLFMLVSTWAGGVLREMAPGDPVIDAGAEIIGGALAFIALFPALTSLPALLAVIAGEILGIRSWIYYVLAGGASLAVIPFMAGQPEAGPPAAAYTTLFAAAGFAGGFVYWLLAGRRA